MRTLPSHALRLAIAIALAASSEAAETSDPNSTIRMPEYSVLGSRIRQTDIAGPSPVSQFDQDFIRATGAMNLADLLNYLPQTYSGIGAGRGSSPNELNPEFGQRTETTTPAINLLLGVSDAPPGQTGVSGISLRGLGSGSTLVLVDGRRVVQSGTGNRGTDSRQSFVDLNGIPLGMIERIEVITDGASAIYGADAVAGVVNIVLKKNWTGSEFTGSIKAAEHGGGQERTATLTSGFVRGKLSGSIGIDYYGRNPLKASDRSFSKNQDHRGIIAGYNNNTGAAVPGRDLRINWGYPALVQARTGTLAGVLDASRNATPLAVVPTGATSTPSPAQFIGLGPTGYNATTGAPLYTASGASKGNTARFLDLVPSSERFSLSAQLKYRLGEASEVYVRASNADVRGLFNTQPGVSSASASTGFGNYNTTVPALINGVPNPYNPFGQDVVVGLIHWEFGSNWQSTHSKTFSLVSGLRGRMFATWRWDVTGSWQNYRMDQVTRLFNPATVPGALTNPDQTRRLNPFLDARAAGLTQASIYAGMARYNTLNSQSSLRNLEFDADGEVYRLPGGPIRAALGGSYERTGNEQSAVNQSEAVVPVVTTSFFEGDRNNHALFAELSVPLFGKTNALPLLRRLDAQLAGRYEGHAEYSKTVPKYGASWVPVQSLLFRASYSEGFRAPALTEYQVVSSPYTTSVVDPRRTPATTTGVVVTRGSNPNVTAETSQNEFVGLVFEPPFAKGLTLQVNYYRTTQQNVIQVLSPQTIVNNEALFAARITRAAPTATDTAAGQPGQVTAVNQTFINFGRVGNESVDYALEYALPREFLGRWRIGFNATRTLESTRRVAPGQPELILDGDTFAPPAWKWMGSLFWNRGNLNGSLFVNYLGGFRNNSAGNNLTANSATVTYNPTPAVTRVDLRAGYSFEKGIWRGWAQRLRVSAGIGNVFDRKPPFSDTIFGYNGGLHSNLVLGRTYEFSLTQPF